MPVKKTVKNARKTPARAEKPITEPKKDKSKTASDISHDLGGRPGTSEPRIKKFILRLTSAERREIDQYARNLGIDPSAFVRMAVFSTENKQTFDSHIVERVTVGAPKSTLFMAFSGAEFYRLKERSEAHGSSINSYCRLAAAHLCEGFASGVEPLGPPIDLKTLEGKLKTTAESKLDQVKTSLGFAQNTKTKAVKKK